MNKDKDSSLVESQEYKTLKHAKSISQAGELPKKTLTVHLSRCMSQRNLPGTKVQRSKSLADYSNISTLGKFIEGYIKLFLKLCLSH